MLNAPEQAHGDGVTNPAETKNRVLAARAAAGPGSVSG